LNGLPDVIGIDPPYQAVTQSSQWSPIMVRPFEPDSIATRRCILAVAMRTGYALLLSTFGCRALWRQTALRGLVDAHVHYNGDKAFLEKMVARLDPFDGTAFVLTQAKDIPDALAR